MTASKPVMALGAGDGGGMSDNQQENGDLATEMAAFQANLDAELKNRYRPEYMQAAKKKLSLMDAFRGADGRLAKIEKIAETRLQEDLENGTLEARARADVGIEDKPANGKQVFEAGEFGFLDVTEELKAQEVAVHPAEVPKQYSVQIPNVGKLLTEATDDTFLNYVLENLHSYDVATPGFIEAPEVRAGKKGGHELFITVVEKKFSYDGENFARNAASADKLLLLHSDTQNGLIKAGADAINSYNATGTIPQELREEFIIEETKESLRTANYPLTEQYENFCAEVLEDVAQQIDRINGFLPEAPVKYNLQAKIDFGTAPKAKAPKR